DAFARATPEVVEHAIVVVGELPPVARCDDAVTADVDPARAEAANERIANARASHAAGRDDAALAELAAVARDADAPIALAAGLLEAGVLAGAGRFDDARGSARRAFDTAITIGDRRSAAEAAVDLVFLGAYDPSRIAESMQWVQTGKSLVGKLADAVELDAQLANAEGHVLLAAGIAAAAHPAFERAVADFRRIDPDHYALGSSLAALGTAELDRGLLDDAERDLRDGVARAEADLGPD